MKTKHELVYLNSFFSGGVILKSKKKVFKPYKTFVIYILVVIAIYASFNICFFNAVIPSSSMETTIMTGDRVLGSRLSIWFGSINKGDILIFKKGEKHLVKRVIAVEGDTVDIRNGKVYVNGNILNETYTNSKETVKGKLEYPLKVPKDSYFMLGDNRNNSEDSRYWDNPFLSGNDVEAKVVFRYYPFNNICVIGG